VDPEAIVLQAHQRAAQTGGIRHARRITDRLQRDTARSRELAAARVPDGEREKATR
jgi:hypothetical protein